MFCSRRAVRAAAPSPYGRRQRLDFFCSLRRPVSFILQTRRRDEPGWTAAALRYPPMLSVPLEKSVAVGEVECHEDIYRPYYVRGPKGIIVELVQQIG